MLTEDILQSLNPAQKKAVTCPLSNLLVLAGAGSGKTRVLTTRFSWLIQKNGLTHHNILALTFTNKAAQEMIHRIQKNLNLYLNHHAFSNLWIGTFHSICYRILRRHTEEAGLKEVFEIIDTSTKKRIIKNIIKTSWSNASFTPQVAYNFIQKAKQEGKRANKVHVDRQHPALHELYQIYEDYCQKNSLVDFNEIILKTYELLDTQSHIRESYQNRFSAILIDEFQDTDYLQYELIKKLSKPETSVFAVGDDDQSIYSFRGARSDNLNRFCQEFQVGEVIRLEQNYRSQGNILNTANSLIKKNKSRLGKELWSSKGNGERVKIVPAQNEYRQATWLAEEISQLKNSGEPLEEIAILYRTNAQSAQIEHALFSSRLPYRVMGHLRFYERTEIKDALAYLRLIANPHDNFSFLRAVKVPTRGIGDKTIAKIQETAEFEQISLYQAAFYFKGPPQQFAYLVNQLTEHLVEYNLVEMIRLIVEESGLLAYYQKQADHEERVNNLEALIRASEFYSNQIIEEKEEINNLPILERKLLLLNDFLAYTMLTPTEEGGQTVEKVQLMTVHMAKGLEFNCVFIVGVEQGLFPSPQSITNISLLEEERRLMYVAITRAKRKLHISYCNSPSQFVYELPSNHIEKKYLFSSL